jgi:hypothetical protein
MLHRRFASKSTDSILARSLLVLGLAAGLLFYGEGTRAATITPSVQTLQSSLVYTGGSAARVREGPRVESRGDERGEYAPHRERRHTLRKARGGDAREKARQKWGLQKETDLAPAKPLSADLKPDPETEEFVKRLLRLPSEVPSDQ